MPAPTTTHEATAEAGPRADDWRRAQTFADFLPTAEENADLWRLTYERADVPADLVARAEALLGAWRLLVLSEDWCGDAANSVPVLAAFAEAARNVELRLLARDENAVLMDEHLTNGSRSIPVVMVLDGRGRELGWWGPRPADLQAWVMSEGKAMEPADRYREVRKWYARDKGRTTLDEVVRLMERQVGAGRPGGPA